MKGITGRPTAGMRLSVERVEEGAGAGGYRGFVHLPDADVPIEASASAAAVRVSLGPGGTPEMEKWAAALVRAATKGPLLAGAPLPRKIVRWRA